MTAVHLWHTVFKTASTCFVSPENLGRQGALTYATKPHALIGVNS